MNFLKATQSLAVAWWYTVFYPATPTSYAAAHGTTTDTRKLGAMSLGLPFFARPVSRLQIRFSTQLYTSSRDKKKRGSSSQVGWVWLEQARVNRRILHNIAESLTFYPEASAHACFLSQQVSELSLKAARLHLDPSTPCRNHKLQPHALKLEKHQFFPNGLLIEAIKPLEKYYTPTRYPNCHNNEVAPASLYNTSQALDAIDRAEVVYQEVKDFMENFWVSLHSS